MKKLNAILYTGLLAGTLDALAAILQHFVKGGSNPQMIFKFIASGVFGKSAFSGRLEMVLFGVLFHYIIATIWTALFFMIYPKIKIRTSWLVAGLVYGIIVWCGMNLVVLPLSNTPPLNREWMQSLVGMLILIVAIGWPIAWSQKNSVPRI